MNKMTQFQVGQLHQFLIDKYPIPFEWEGNRYEMAVDLFSGKGGNTGLTNNEIVNMYEKYITEKLPVYSTSWNNPIPRIKCFRFRKERVFFQDSEVYSQDSYYQGRCYQYLVDYGYKNVDSVKDIVLVAEAIHFNKVIAPWCREGREYDIDFCCGTWYYGDNRCSCDNYKVRLYVGELDFFEIPRMELDSYEPDEIPYARRW
jgi:hypothetical protein